jgi:hypothetical protein
MTIHAVRGPRIAGPESAPAVLPQPKQPAAPAGGTGAAEPAVPVSASSPPSPFAELVRGLGHEVQRGEAAVHDAVASARGGNLGPAELIALQAGVYRYSEAVDLASRLVDHATSGLKTVVQGQ